VGEVCSNCRFWVKDTENRVRDFGLCHHNSPIMVPQHSSCATWMGSGWPESKPNDWCGQFERAHDAPALNKRQR
jgi:hypothetical protein